MITDEEVPSPCRRCCCLNDEDVCLGCYRTLKEICGWSKMSRLNKRQVLSEVEKRKKQKKP